MVVIELLQLSFVCHLSHAKDDTRPLRSRKFISQVRKLAFALRNFIAQMRKATLLSRYRSTGKLDRLEPFSRWSGPFRSQSL